MAVFRYQLLSPIEATKFGKSKNRGKTLEVDSSRTDSFPGGRLVALQVDFCERGLTLADHTWLDPRYFGFATGMSPGSVCVPQEKGGRNKLLSNLGRLFDVDPALFDLMTESDLQRLSSQLNEYFNPASFTQGLRNQYRYLTGIAIRDFMDSCEAYHLSVQKKDPFPVGPGLLSCFNMNPVTPAKAVGNALNQATAAVAGVFSGDVE